MTTAPSLNEQNAMGLFPMAHAIISSALSDSPAAQGALLAIAKPWHEKVIGQPWSETFPD